MEQGLIKYGNTNNNDKSKFWSRNKNVTNEGIVDARTVNITQPVLSLGMSQSSNPCTENNLTSTNVNATKNMNTRYLRVNTPRRNYTPLGEPIESALKKLIQTNMIILPEIRVYEPGPFKPTWWNDNDFCDYHRTKGHKTASCYKFKNLVQDMIDQGDITIDTDKTSANMNHTIFKDPFVKHDKGKATTSGSQDNTTNYTKVSYDYTIHAISLGDIVNNDSQETLDQDEKYQDTHTDDNQICMISEAPKYDDDRNLCIRDWGHDQPSHSGWFEDELIEHIKDVKHTHKDYEEGYNINLDNTAYDTDNTRKSYDIVATITINLETETVQ